MGEGTARILEVASYPPPRSGWSVRIEFLKKRLEECGHTCVVLNLGPNRRVPSPDYETVLGGTDFLRKLWRFSREGFVVHAHTNGDSLKGVLLAIVAEAVNLAWGHRCFLTFHAGAIQRYFPRDRAWWLVPVYGLLFTIPRRIICNNEAVRDRIRGYGVPRRKIVAIPAFTRQYLDYTPSPLPPTLEAFFERFPQVVLTYARMRPLFFPLTMIDGMARVMERRADVGLVLLGGLSHMEGWLWKAVQERIGTHGLEDRICLVGDLTHDEFLTALRRCSLYLRTPITDGVASSVMESLALGIPVVACENGTRPAAVITYPPEDAERLDAAVEHVIVNRDAIVVGLKHESVPDTLDVEVAVLTGAPAGGERATEGY